MIIKYIMISAYGRISISIYRVKCVMCILE